MIAVKPAGKYSLLVKIFVRHNKEKMSARPYQLPPLLNCLARISHVFQTMRGEYKIEFLMHVLGDLVGVASLLVKSVRARGNGIGSATNINSPPCEN